ncbi:Dolichyl-phosphate-mannose--protein mannosyltransferase 1, partial [Coemansia sp. RSA 25]
SVGFLSIGWVLHWIPFFLMGRQLFLHHYLPALWLAILALVGSLDLFTRRLSRKVRQVLMFGLLLATVRMYFQYSHIAYGSPWTRQGCERSKWFKSWDYDCYRFPELGVTTPVTPAIKPNVPEVPMPTIGAPDIGENPVAIAKNDNGEVVPNKPPPAQNFDPLEHENKLNEPAPEIHQDHLNSNSAKLDLDMKKKATTVVPGKDAAAASDEHKDEHIAGAGH